MPIDVKPLAISEVKFVTPRIFRDDRSFPAVGDPDLAVKRPISSSKVILSGRDRRHPGLRDLLACLTYRSA